MNLALDGTMTGLELTCARADVVALPSAGRCLCGLVESETQAFELTLRVVVYNYRSRVDLALLCSIWCRLHGRCQRGLGVI